MNRSGITKSIMSLVASGWLFAGGCGAVLERGFDILLTPGAAQNAIELVTSGLRPLVSALFRLD